MLIRKAGAEDVEALVPLFASWGRAAPGTTRSLRASSRSRSEAHAFYPALGYDEQSERQARYRREL